ncbi:putative BRCT domain, BRCA1-associated, BRCT domain superfamily [Helianthus anomalus]
MAILNGKWVVTMEWLMACVDVGRVVNEEPYEVHLDTHGCSGGPTAGRLRALSNE